MHIVPFTVRTIKYIKKSGQNRTCMMLEGNNVCVKHLFEFPKGTRLLQYLRVDEKIITKCAV